MEDDDKPTPWLWYALGIPIGLLLFFLRWCPREQW